MEELKNEIAIQLSKLEEMIENKSNKKEIERQKKILDKLLEKFTKDL